MADPKHSGQIQERRKPPLPALSEDTIRDMVALQKQDLELRTKELDLRIHETQSNAKTAEQMIGAQERDREAQRTHIRAANRQQLVFWALVVLGILVIIFLGMYLGKEALVLDLVKVSVGALGGYGARAAQSSKKPTDDD